MRRTKPAATPPNVAGIRDGLEPECELAGDATGPVRTGALMLC